MPDIFDRVAAGGDIFDQVASTPTRDSLLSRAKKGITNFAVSTARAAAPLAFAAAPLLPEKTKQDLSNFYDEAGGFLAQNQPTKPEGISDRVVDAASGLAPAIASGPVGVVALLNNAITGKAAESRDAGDSWGTTIGKTAASGAAMAGNVALPLGRTLKTMGASGAGAVAINNADRLAQNAMSGEKDQQAFDVTTNVLEPLIMQLGFGGMAHFNRARASSKLIDGVAGRMERGEYVPAKDINSAVSASKVFLRRGKRQAAQDRIATADSGIDARYGTEPIVPGDTAPLADSEFSPDFGRPAPTVLDAEVSSPNAQTSVMPQGAHPDTASIEVARLKQEHPYWSDAEYLKEVQRTTLTQNPEVLPARTDERYVSEPAPAERPGEQAPSRTVEPQSMENFNHDSLPTAAVTAADSLVLQDAAPHLKIAVVGTPAEIKALGKQPTGKTTWVNGDKAYIIDTAAARDKYGSVLEAKRALKAGDPEALGYPSREMGHDALLAAEEAVYATKPKPLPKRLRGDLAAMSKYEAEMKDWSKRYREAVKATAAAEPLQTAAVTKAGEILTEPEAIKQAATAGEVAYAAEGAPADLAAKIEPVADALAPAGRGREFITPENDILAGVNAAGEKLYDRADGGGRYRIRNDRSDRPNGYPDHGGDLAPAGQKGGGPVGKEEGRQEVLKGQVDLHAGLHLPTLVKQAKDVWKHYTEKLDPTAPAGSVKEFQERNAVANKRFGKDGIFRAARRAMLDTSANAQNELMAQGLPGQWARREYDAISGATGRSEYRKEKARSAIIDGLSLRERQAFDRKVPLDRELAIAEYRGSQFNVEVDKKHVKTEGGVKYSYTTKETTPDDYTFMGGFTPEQIRAARERFQKDYKLTDAEQASSDKATKAYFEAWKGNTERLLEAGMIDATQKAELDSHLYSPKQFLDKIDPFVKTSSGASVPDSGIKRLDKGSDRYYRDNPMALLEEAIDRVETRIARNEANRALAAIPDGTGIFTRPDRADAPVPPGSVALRYMEKGEQKVLHVNEEFAKEWEATDPMLNPLLAAAMEVGTGRGAVRAAATGHNPLFAVVNMPVDALTIWAQPEGYSPHLPVALYQMAGNLRKVKGDAWKHEGRYEDWVMKEKGGRDMLTQYGSMTSRRSQLQPEVRKVLNATSKIGRFSEEVSRLAYREQLIKSGKDPLVAGKMAAEYVDFSRGGWLTKALDKMGAVYLNAGMQGFRSMARASGKNPALFAYKVAQLGLVASTLYGFNQLVNPEGWRNVDDKTKADNFIVMTPPYFNYVDKNGTTVSPYFKIKKEQFIRPFTSVAEALWQMAYEGKDPRQQIKFAIEGANPLSISKLIPPTGKLYLAYAHNVDIFKERPVWRGKQDIAPFAEYTQTTNPILTAIGKATATTGKDGQLEGGVSPERLGAALSQVIIPSNLFVNTGIGALTRAFEKMNPSDKVEFAKGNYEKLVDFLGGTRLLGGAKDTEQFREGIREARTGTATEQFEVNKTLDAMVLRYVKTGKSDAALYDRISDFLDKQSGESRARLENRITGLMETADLPDRGWWMAVRALQPEDRADQFKARLQTVSPEEQQRMIQIADGLTGFVSERFIERYEGAQ